jgi:hypothetical protein
MMTTLLCELIPELHVWSSDQTDFWRNASNIGPSVIPEYTPSVRVFTYNITGADSDGTSLIVDANDELLDSEE